MTWTLSESDVFILPLVTCCRTGHIPTPSMLGDETFAKIQAITSNNFVFIWLVRLVFKYLKWMNNLHVVSKNVEKKTSAQSSHLPASVVFQAWHYPFCPSTEVNQVHFPLSRKSCCDAVIWCVTQLYSTLFLIFHSHSRELDIHQKTKWNCVCVRSNLEERSTTKNPLV